jgi:hypothetical protein
MLAPGSMITALPAAPITIADHCRRAFALGNLVGARTKQSPTICLRRGSAVAVPWNSDCFVRGCAFDEIGSKMKIDTFTPLSLRSTLKTALVGRYNAILSRQFYPKSSA